MARYPDKRMFPPHPSTISARSSRSSSPPAVDWPAGLNAAQLAVATHGDQPLVVVAGAGTGKTRALVSRLAFLLQEGAGPERILLLTFARRAAEEMVARAGELSGGRRAIGGTFHSVAHRYVSAYGEVVGMASGFSVLSPAEASDLMDLMRTEHGLNGGAERFPRTTTLVEIYSRCINNRRPLSEVLKGGYPWCEPHLEKLAALFAAFTERKRKGALVDFDDLLLFWRALLSDDQLGPHLASQFEYVLVDEYQDLNYLQSDIVRLLAPSGRGLTLVGDEAQAIYAFRGGGRSELREAALAFPGASVIELAENFRSHQSILEVANAVRARCHGPGVVLRSSRAPGPRPTLRRCHDANSEARSVVDTVLMLHEEGTPLHDQAVLVRAAHHSDLVEFELAARRVPYRKYGGLKFLEVAHVKDFVAAARVVDNPHDELAWYRLLRLHDGIGPATGRALVEICRAAPDQLAGWQELVAAAPARSRSPLSATLSKLVGAREVTGAGRRAEEVLEALVPLLRGRYPDAGSRITDLERLVAAASEARALGPWLAELTIDPPQGAGDFAGPPHLDEDYLVVSTIHSAKGLEWPVVHLPHVIDGCMPIDMALTDQEGLEEERRLFYVALTRARDQLYLYSPLRMPYHPRAVDDRHGLVKMSRFLDEAVLAKVDVREEPANRASLPAAPAGVRVSVDLSSLWL